MEDIFVLGGNHHNTLGVIRSLGSVGIRSNLILSSKESHPYVSYSRYIKSKWLFESDEEVIAFLKSFHCKSIPIIIACSDSIASLLDANKDELSLKYRLPGVRGNYMLSYYMNKEVMMNLAQEVGFNVPCSLTITEKDRTIPISIPYPLIIKPLVSSEGSKQDIKRCYTKKELDNYLGEDHCNRIIVQQLIEKDFEFQLIGCSMDGGRIVVIPGYAKNIRPSDVTNTGFLKYIPTQDLPIDISLCRAFILKTGYSGLFSLEFVHGKDGKNYFLEMNFRNDGNSICVTASGLNLPYIWYLYNTNKDIHLELDKKDSMKSVYVMPEFDDAILLLKGRVDVLTWLKDLSKTNCFMEFSSKDVKPFFYALYSFVKRTFRYVRKRYN